MNTISQITTPTPASTPASTPTPASTSSTAEQLRPVARQWVGQTFFGTLLKQARSSSFAPEGSPFSGGRGGQAFGSMLDQHLAEHASRGAGEKLVDVLVDRLA